MACGNHYSTKKEKIKTLTGAIRSEHGSCEQDFFAFSLAFELVIAGNHKPALGGVDEPIRRRFHMVPFTVPITEPDRELISREPRDGVSQRQSGRYISSMARRRGSSRMPPLLATPQGL